MAAEYSQKEQDQKLLDQINGVNRAVLAERERCAKIAEARVSHLNQGHVKEVALEIAAAIRSGK